MSSSSNSNSNSSNHIPNGRFLARKHSEPAFQHQRRHDHEDFVSADVNEVLQDARDVLENRERREEHPNELVVDESTTVKVTKTGGDEDPIQVSVLRHRLVKREDVEEDEEEQDEQLGKEDRGWSSDTDLISTAQRARMPSIHKCSHRRKVHGGSIGHIQAGIGEDQPQEAETTTSERHMNVIYRRRHKDDLWRKQEEELEEDGTGPGKGKQVEQEEEDHHQQHSMGEKKDGAQLKVEITEQCRTTQQGTHFVQQTWETTWNVQSFHSLPDWLQDNDFLHTGHRPPLPSFAVCFKSILSVHTETGNIWTHLIGCLAFFFLFLWFLTRPDTHILFQEKLVFSFFFAGAILCLGLSFTFHTVSCHSKFVVRIFSRLDYAGISLLIVGSFIPWIYYGFYCRREPKITYIAMIAVMGLGSIVTSLWDKFNDKRYRPLRAGIFSCMGLSAGKCDILFQSHQLFHVCVVCAALAHYYGISNMAMLRLTGTCPGTPPLHSQPSGGLFSGHNEL